MLPTFEESMFADIPDMMEMPETTTAIIQQYAPQFGELWDIGTQMATTDGKPYSRSYSLLSFPDNTSSIDVIQLGYYAEDYEGTFYYLVANHFLEDSYNSSIDLSGDDSKDFLRWQKTTTKYRQEVTFAHQPLSTLHWDRPSTAFQIGPGGESIFQYQDLPSTYTLPLVSAGYALAATVAVTPGNSRVEVRLKSSPTDTTPSEPKTGLILMTKPYLEITLLDVGNSVVTSTPIPDDPMTPFPDPYTQTTIDNSGVTHTRVSVTFYGKFKWRTFMPVSTEDERTLIHPVNAPLATKLKPPGLAHLPDNFWNSNPNLENFQDYYPRQSSPPAWT